ASSARAASFSVLDSRFRARVDERSNALVKRSTIVSSTMHPTMTSRMPRRPPMIASIQDPNPAASESRTSTRTATVPHDNVTMRSFDLIAVPPALWPSVVTFVLPVPRCRRYLSGGSGGVPVEVLRPLGAVGELPTDRFDRAPGGLAVTIRVDRVRHGAVRLARIEQQ